MTYDDDLVDDALADPLPTGDPRRRTWWTAADLMATAFPDPRWAVRDLLAEGVTLLAGAPKVGKSWLVGGVAIAVAAGGRALSTLECEQGEVLYLALEDHPRRMKDRLSKMLNGDRAPRGLTLAFAYEQDQVDAWLTKRNKRLLIIDVLARVRGATPPGAIQYDQDYAVMRRIKAMADEHELAVVAVHHTRKMASDDFLNEVSGTNGLAGGADAVMVLKRLRGDADGELHLTGRDVPESEFALKFDADLGLWSKLEGRPADYKLSDARAAILRYLKTNGSGTPKQIADALGIQPNTVRGTLRRMFDDGQVDEAGRGAYIAVTPVTLQLENEDDRC